MILEAGSSIGSLRCINPQSAARRGGDDSLHPFFLFELLSWSGLKQSDQDEQVNPREVARREFIEGFLEILWC